jgi:hypothetical protein
MFITHLVVDDSLLVRLALMYNLCSNVVDIWLRSENIRRSSLSYLPTPPNSKEQGQSSALAARTSEVHSHHRALLEFNIFTAKTLKMFIEKCFLCGPALKPFSRVTMEELRTYAPRNRRRLPPAFQCIPEPV